MGCGSLNDNLRNRANIDGQLTRNPLYRHRVDIARQQYGRAIVMQRRLVADHSGDASFASQLAESVANLGMLEDGQGHQEAAERGRAGSHANV